MCDPQEPLEVDRVTTATDPNLNPIFPGEQPLHPSVDHVLQFFDSGHLPPHLAEVVEPCVALAHGMAQHLPNNPELTAGLRKLLEAKDCFVRARIAGGEAP